MGIRRATNRGQCMRSGGTWRKGVKGVRKGSCAMPSTRSPAARRRANLAGGRKVSGKKMGGFIKRGKSCPTGFKKVIVRSRTNRRGTPSCVRR